MATNKKEAMSQFQYEELRRGYAENLGFKLDSLSQEQEHQLIEAMAADGIFAPSTKALPGEVNPSNGNGVEIVTATKGKAANRGKGKKPAASVGSLDASIKQALVSAAEQGGQIGNLAGAVFTHQLITQRDAVITDALADALIPSEYAGMSLEDFLPTI